MENKNMLLLVLPVFILIIIYLSFSYLNNNYENKLNNEYKDNNVLKNEDNKNDFQEIKEDINKKISIDMEKINPNNYDSVNEFLGYLQTASGINLDVDLIKEDFFISTFKKGSITIVKFDKDLKKYVDTSENNKLKNQAIEDIYNSYKTNKYILGNPTLNRSGIRLLKDHELPSNYRLHNNILDPYKGVSFLKMKSDLENKKNKSDDEKKELAYLNDFSGDYDKSLKIKESLNIEKINYKITGRVFHLGNSLSGAKVEVLNYKGVESYTNESGEYTLDFEAYPLTRLRLRASLENYSDGFNGEYIIFDYDNQYSEDINFSLLKGDNSILIKKSDLEGNSTKSIKSTIGNEFIFKKGVVIDKNGKIYNGDFIATIFEFNRDTPGMENYLSLDNFDNVYGYTGNMMITNGMTYLMLTDINGNELFISKKNPIITRQMMDLDYLLNNSIGNLPILKKSGLELILEKSKEEGYPINRDFLLKRGIDGFTPWWVLNRTKGIWENRGTKLLNKNGLKESLYYNVD